MSADGCVAYIGVRYEIEPAEIDALETRSDHRQLAAREAGLKSYWGNFGGIEERYVLFVGTELAVLGPEAKPCLSLTSGELQTTITQTGERLNRVGIDEAVGLHIEFQEDV